MATYVIYERSTGKIVHTHVQPDDMPMMREALCSLTEQDPAKLDILLIDPQDVDAEGLYSVDPKSKRLQPAKEKTAAGFAIGGIRRIDSKWPVGPVTVNYTSTAEAQGEPRKRK